MFSNYNIISLFTSDNGGSSWTNISGNLEENSNGSGSGPSCRWAAVLNLDNGRKSWFIGTSVGLYATDTLNGIQTRWIQQSPNRIGNNIVTMLDTRNLDNFIAVATHGNGAYSANISNPWQITNLRSENLKDLNAYPNPLNKNELLKIDFKNNSIQNLEISILDNLGNAIPSGYYKLHILDQKHISIQFANLTSGIYFINIQTDDGYWIEKISVQ